MDFTALCWTYLDGSVPLVLVLMVGGGRCGSLYHGLLGVFFWDGDHGVLGLLQPGPLFRRALLTPANLQMQKMNNEISI